MRTYLRLLTAFFCFVILTTSCKKDINEIEPAEESDQRLTGTAGGQPNILILFGDDVGYEIPSCDGGQSYSTPNIDRMAQNGKRFTECHAGPICCPSRLMLFTGKYNFRNYTEWNYMSTDNKTFANMLKDNGYATCYAGKWQLGGGDASIRSFGWDKYAVWQPFQNSASEEGNRYKSARIYQDGDYLPTEQTDGVYSEDKFTQYLLNFMDSAKSGSKPFIAFYSMITCHGPFQPTPDDPEYAGWDTSKSNTKFFPSMVKYHDKKIGQIIDYMNTSGLLRNTVVMYFADNGTPPQITSLFNGFSVPGGKGETTEPGTNVPMIVYGPSRIPKGATSNILIDLTDFMPTIKDIAGIKGPLSGYGKLDGASFAPAIVSNKNFKSRKYIYDAYSMHPENGVPFKRWTQNDSYKLYDTVPGPQSGQFVKITKGKPDSAPLQDNELTPAEQSIKEQFTSVLRIYN